MEQSPARLKLADDVFVCIVDRHAVFLDLGRDDYSAVPLLAMPDADAVPEAVEEFLQAELQRHRGDLQAVGLLCNAGSGHSGLVDFLSISPADDHVFGRDDDRCYGISAVQGSLPRIRLGDWLQFFLAAWKASRLLRHRHIAKIAAHVIRRKASHRVELNLEDLRRQLSIFRRLRPWYPRAYLCLWDSLALIEFLATRRHFPDWIYGVQVEPFGAHCWLQVGDKVLNEDTEYAKQFVPIMLV